MKIKKVFIIIFIGLFLLIALVTSVIIYLNKTYIPTKAKAYLIETIEDKLNHKVEIANLRLSFTKGITISGLKVYETDPTKAFLKADEINLILLFWPLFKKTIIIPSASINNLRLFLIRDKNGSLNLPNINESEDKSKFSYLIKKIAFNNSSIEFKDHSVEPIFIKTITDINSIISISILKNMGLKLDASIDKNSRISLKANFNPNKNVIKLKTDINKINLKDYTSYLSFDFETEKILLENIALNSIIDLNQKKLSTEGSFNAADIKVKIDKTLSSIISRIDLKFDYDLTTKKIQDYNLLIEPNQIQLKNLPKLNNLSLSNGKINIINNQALIKDLNLNYQNNLIKINGEISDIAKRALNIKLTSEEINLNSISHLFQNKLNNISVFGTAKLNAIIKGEAKNIDSLFVNGSLTTNNTNINLLNGLIFKNIQTEILFTKNSFSWNNLQCSLNDRSINSQGKFTDFQYPKINAEIQYADFNAETSLNIVDNAISINKLSIKALNSDAQISGIINLKEDEFLKIKSKLNLDLNDINRITPQLEILNQVPIEGKLKINLDCYGPLKNPKLWQVKSDGKANYIKIKNITLDNFSFFYLQENGLIKSLQLESNLYKGKLEFDLTSDLNKKDMPFNAFLNIDSVDIEDLKNDTVAKDKTLAGTLNLEMNSSGYLNDFANMRAKSLVEIKNGYLWGFNPLKKLANSISIVAFEDIIFKEASANLSIQNQKAYTDNLSLHSDELDIFIKGDIDFKGNLDMLASIQTSESMETTKSLSSILMSALGEITKVRISGTIDKPKTSIVPTIPTKDIVDSLKGIFSFD
ncbi:MAG: AsmA-like C-terminal region-containing protein [Candidatus Gygaella obscura]|nr:AsmA-like C-terminal region-containing protein [Candidatus Gygaella obscura]